MLIPNSRPTSHYDNDIYTQLLLHFDGSNGGTTFTDSSSHGRTVTRAGSSTTSTAQIKFGTTSMLCSSGGVTVADSSDLEPGTKDFTFDFWAYPTADNTSAFGKGHTTYAPMCVGPASASGNWTAYISSTGSTWDIANGSTFGTRTLNAWQHVAISRSGSNIYLFVGGVLGNTISTSSALIDTSSSWTVGDGAVNYFQGYIDEFRYSLGVARWTSNFTPNSTAYSDS